MRFTEALRGQAIACTSLGSPFMGQLMTLLADRLTPDHCAVAAKLFDWPGDVSAGGASLPLRIGAGLHALKLDGHPDLSAIYPPHATPEDTLWATISDVLRSEEPFLLDWIDSPPQTNEVRRAAIFRATGQWLAHRYGLPLGLLELGASAGINLNWDRYALTAGTTTFGPDDAVLTLTPQWTGPLPPAAEPTIAHRRGVDLLPVSPKTDRLRLLAYLWPDQPQRLTLTDVALALPAAPVDRGCAADWLDALPPQPANTCRLIQHSVAWQYFPQDVQARAAATIARLGAAATDATPLAHLGMEADGGRGAAVTLTTWPGGEPRQAGRADFHGRWIDWQLA
ncbi:MAG: DUF2332 family protein [Pseudomonadota bacterium]